MKFRIIFDDGENEITIITEDGGIACIRETDDLSPTEPRIAVSDYYQRRLTSIAFSESDNLFEHLAEGQMYHKDWPDVRYNSLTVINDALDWLCPGVTSWELSKNLFSNHFDDQDITL
jgi:hypothetical protein